jgi:hypothetical protein
VVVQHILFAGEAGAVIGSLSHVVAEKSFAEVYKYVLVPLVCGMRLAVSGASMVRVLEVTPPPVIVNPLDRLAIAAPLK